MSKSGYLHQRAISLIDVLEDLYNPDASKLSKILYAKIESKITKEFERILLHERKRCAKILELKAEVLEKEAHKIDDDVEEESLNYCSGTLRFYAKKLFEETPQFYEVNVSSDDIVEDFVIDTDDD